MAKSDQLTRSGALGSGDGDAAGGGRLCISSEIIHPANVCHRMVGGYPARERRMARRRRNPAALLSTGGRARMIAEPSRVTRLAALGSALSAAAGGVAPSLTVTLASLADA